MKWHGLLEAAFLARINWPVFDDVSWPSLLPSFLPPSLAASHSPIMLPYLLPTHLCSLPPMFPPTYIPSHLYSHPPYPFSNSLYNLLLPLCYLPPSISSSLPLFPALPALSLLPSLPPPRDPCLPFLHLLPSPSLPFQAIASLKVVSWLGLNICVLYQWGFPKLHNLQPSDWTGYHRIIYIVVSKNGVVHASYA